MAESGRSLHLAFEAGQNGIIGGLTRLDHLDGARTFEELVLGDVDLAHASGSQLLAEQVLTELARLEGIAADRIQVTRAEDGNDRREKWDGDGVAHAVGAERFRDPRFSNEQPEEEQVREESRGHEHRRGAFPGVGHEDRIDEDQHAASRYIGMFGRHERERVIRARERHDPRVHHQQQLDRQGAEHSQLERAKLDEGEWPRRLEGPEAGHERGEDEDAQTSQGKVAHEETGDEAERRHDGEHEGGGLEPDAKQPARLVDETRASSDDEVHGGTGFLPSSVWTNSAGSGSTRRGSSDCGKAWPLLSSLEQGSSEPTLRFCHLFTLLFEQLQPGNGEHVAELFGSAEFIEASFPSRSRPSPMHTFRLRR